MACAMGPQTQQSDVQSHAWRSLFRKQFRKTKLCRFYSLGECKYGAECAYAHDSTEVANAPDLTKTTICKDYQRGSCPKKCEDCQFAHGIEDLRVTSAFGSTFLRKRVQKIVQHQQQQQQQQQQESTGHGTDNAARCNRGSHNYRGSCEDRGSRQANAFAQQCANKAMQGGGSRNHKFEEEALTDGLVSAHKKNTNRSSEHMTAFSLHGALMGSTWPDTSHDVGVPVRLTPFGGAGGPPGRTRTPDTTVSVHAGNQQCPTLLTQMQMQLLCTGMSGFIPCRSVRPAVGVVPEHDARISCDMTSEMEPQKLLRQQQPQSPPCGMDMTPMRVDVTEMEKAPAAPKSVYSPVTQDSPSLMSQWPQTQKPPCTSMGNCGLDYFDCRASEEAPCWKANQAQFAGGRENVIDPRLSASSRQSTDTESTKSQAHPDCPSPVHRWGISPSVAVSLSPERSPVNNRYARTPSSAASPERGSPMRGWARTPSTVASPDLSPLRTRGRSAILPPRMDVPSLLNIFGNSGHSHVDGGYLPCRNSGLDWPDL